MTSWIEAVEFFKTETFADIIEDLEQRKARILPAREHWFRAFRETPFEKVKVVILGQDPYPTASHAMGLAFSVPEDVKPLPKSLQNIFRELKDDTGTERSSGDLTNWTKQGVFLLNTSLTVLEGQPGTLSSIGWSRLAREAIQALSKHHEHLVFILWGSHATAMAQFIDEEKHLIITSPHPSPLAAYRGFFGSKPFSRANQYLVEHGKDPIVW